MPGSGKGMVLATLIKMLTNAKKRILLVSHSNQTIDSTLLKLKDQGFDKFLRVTSNLSSVDPSLRTHVRLANKFSSYADIREVIDNFQVFAMTCMQLSNPLLLCTQFDYCLMGDASSLSEPLAVGPLLLV